MKRFRVLALAASIAVCLLAGAPAAQAGNVTTVSAGRAAGSPVTWLADWLQRLAGWLGWDQGGPASDCGGGIDPDGTPCNS